MDERVVCPSCQAQLVLPPLPAGQTVQCPRCRHVFEPFRQRSRPAIAAPPPPPVVDDQRFVLPRDIDRPLPLGGEKLGKIASWLIGVCCLFCAIQLIQYIETARLIENLLDQGLNPARFEWEERLFNMEGSVGTVNIMRNFAAFPAGIIYLMWVYQASKNLRVLKAAGVRYSPAGSVWSHFIPLGNLVLPYLALQEIWRASDPDRVDGSHSWQKSPASPLIRAFWAAGIVAWLSEMIGSQWYSERHFFMRQFNGILAEDLRDQRMSVGFHIVANLAAIMAGVLLILIIRGIAQRQRDRHNEVYRD